MKHADYLNIAARYAKRDDERSYHLGALGVRADGAIVLSRNGPLPLESKANGRYMRTPQAYAHLLAHAEHRLCRKLNAGSVVYVARLKAEGEWAMARPCRACGARLTARGVRRVYYTIAPNDYGCLLLG